MPVFLKHHFNHIEDLYEKYAMQILQTLLLSRAAKVVRCFSVLFKLQSYTVGQRLIQFELK